MTQPCLNNDVVSKGEKPATEAIDEFLGIISHELRVPMMAILGWAEILNGGEVDPATLATGLKVIRRNARFQAELIKELLDYSSIGSKKFLLSIRRVSLQAIIEASIETLLPISSEKLIDMNMYPDSAHSEMDGDPVRLQQLFSNILFNAIKFTNRGGNVKVKLRTGENWHTVAVIDTGEGISAEFLPFVFEPYRQADQTTSGRGGLGLGLMVARRIVELHHGTIKAESDGLEKGAVFTLQLPCRQPTQISSDLVT